MNDLNDETKYRKKSQKKSPKKSDHKHEYELTKIEEWSIKNWFTDIEVCKTCGKVREKLRIED